MTFDTQQHDTLAAILAMAARQEIMPRFRNLSAEDIREKKSATDIVTEADEAAERVICAELAKAFPGAVLVGEEAASANPGIVDALAQADLAFVVDPVDGTLNYAAGLTTFATMAAVLVRGEPVAAVIHDPVVNDFAMARKGAGAWMQRADGARTALRVAPALPLAEMTGMVSWRYFDEPNRSRLPGRFPRVTDVSSLRCCGQEYRLAAAGHCHFLAYGRLNAWDHAPGTLIFQEAGGHVATIDGAPYRPAAPRVGLLCAPDAASWGVLRAALFE